MTPVMPPVLAGYLGDEPFDLDWTDVRERSERIEAFGVAAPARPWAVRVRWRVAIATAIVTVAVGVPLTAVAFGLVFAGTPTPHPLFQSGPIEIPLSGMSSAASTSAQIRIAGGRRRVSIVIAGTFPLPHPLRPEATPLPPAGRVAISVRHFPASGTALRWQRVKTLRLPPQERRRFVILRTRLGAEALQIEVLFGSSPTRQQLALANTFLAGIRNNGE